MLDKLPALVLVSVKGEDAAGVCGVRGLFWLKFGTPPFSVLERSGVLLLACICAAGILGAGWNGRSLLSMKFRSIVAGACVVMVRRGGSTGASVALGNSVPSIFGIPCDVLGRALPVALTGVEGSEGALLSSSIVISNILKDFLLAVLFVLLTLFLDDIETLSPSSRCPLDRDMASESLPPLSYDTVLLTFSFRLATRGMGGSSCGDKAALLFLLVVPKPSLVFGRRESSEGFEDSEKGDRGGSSKSNVIWRGLTSGVSLAFPLDMVVVVPVEAPLPCASCCWKGGAGGRAAGGAGGGAGGVLMAGGGGAALRFFLENMMVAFTARSSRRVRELDCVQPRSAIWEAVVAQAILALSFDQQPQGPNLSSNLGDVSPCE